MGACFKRGSYHPPAPSWKGGAEIGAGGHPQGPRQRGYAPLDSRSQADRGKEPSSLWELASNAARITPLAASFQEGGQQKRGWGTPPVPPPKGLRPSGLPLSGNAPSRDKENEQGKGTFLFVGACFKRGSYHPPGRFLSGRGSSNRGWGTLPVPPPKGLRPSGLPRLRARPREC